MDSKFTLGQEEASTVTSFSEELARELPAMAAGTVVGVVLFILLAIGMVFTLGVLLDCRQQKALESKLRRARPRPRRRALPADDVENEAADIASNMQPAACSPPPAIVLSPVRVT